MSQVTKQTLSILSDARIRAICLLKILKIKKRLAPCRLSKNDKKAFRKRWKHLSRLVFTDWARVYAHVTGKWSVDYVPEDIYYCHVEPVLNYMPMLKSETCKANYNKIYDGYNFPTILFKNENGVFYDAEDRILKLENDISSLIEAYSNARSVVVKPSIDSGGGYHVMKFVRNDEGEYVTDSVKLTLDMLKRVYKKDYLIQEAIEQHDYFASFNVSSVNTLRILTYRSVKDESIHVLHTILRIGVKGSATDNQASGGFSVAVDHSGRLNNYAVNKMGIKVNALNGIEFSKAKPVPCIDRFHVIACSLARKLKYSRIIGHDITMDINGNIIIVEVNNKSNEINFFQMNNGPLFGAFTSEIIEYCLLNSRSYCFDYILK